MHYYQSSDTVFRAVPLHEAHRGCLPQTAERSTKTLHTALPAQDDILAPQSTALF